MSDHYYESKTAVWLVGDRAGYQYFLQALAKAETARLAVDLYKRIPRSRNSMFVVLLPAVKTTTRQPRVRLIERIVFRTRKPAMELVIVANTAGYRRLAKLVRGVMRPGRVPLDDHVHFDDWSDDWVVKRSVALTIRTPLRSWRKSALGHYVSMLYDVNPHLLPPDIQWLSPKNSPYQVPSAEAYPLLDVDR